MKQMAEAQKSAAAVKAAMEQAMMIRTSLPW
uniref:Uncharacterized protein n=1 Tax=Arundo donax TaxID=35708 RepID=A0A0A8ZH20_ARUDO